MTLYRNPIARAGDFADPFVLRHNGRYYLYCTNPDVRCWSSTDLIEWRLEGPTIDDTEFPGLVPFAPEVVYADGFFYMYTSPSGHGHFVLRADSPLGPFRAITGNVSHAIDGNVFIDDDGRWYFYWAGDEGIWGCELSSPTDFGHPVFTGIHMNGWTEGPFVSKRDGVYFMTLTGNHYLSSGYRIDAASSEHPLHGYRPSRLNPILIGADGPNLGLGHSSSVIGPDLVSTYLIYHNLNPDESRDLDLDRQVWSGRELQVLGPTLSAPAPAAPDLECDWTAGAAGWSVRSGELGCGDGWGSLSGPDAQVVWTTASVGELFTAEVNLTAGPGVLDYGLTVGDALTLRVDRRRGTVSAVLQESADPLVSGALPDGFNHDALHCWRLTGDHGRLRLFVDGRQQLAFRVDLTRGAQLGVFATGPLRIGHCALTHTVPSRADRAAPKPVPGRFWASLGVAGDSDADVTAGEDTYQAVQLHPGGLVEYVLHVQRDGRYRVYVAGRFAGDDALFLSIDGVERHLEATSPSVSKSMPVELAAGPTRLTVLGRRGSPVLALITLVPVPEPRAVTFLQESLSGVGKLSLDELPRDDVAIAAEVSVDFEAAEAHADLLLRASEFSEGGEGTDTRLGMNFLLGYSIQLHRDRVVLARHDYDETILATHQVTVAPSITHELGVRASGGSLSVEFNRQTLFSVEDSLPHHVGRLGLRTSDAHLRVSRLHASPVTADELPG